MDIVWLPVAIADRERLVDYIAARNPLAAIEQGDRIAQAIERLSKFPEIGRMGRVQGTRELVIPGTPYVKVYRLNRPRGRMEILRILHGAMRWPPTAEDER